MSENVKPVDYQSLKEEIGDIIYAKYFDSNFPPEAKQILDLILGMRIICNNDPFDPKVYIITEITGLNPYPFSNDIQMKK